MSKFKFLLLAFVLVLVSCNSKKPRDREKVSSKPYHREDNELKANLFLYHGTNNTTFLYYKINNTQILYKKIDTNNYFSSRIRVSYKFHPSANDRQIADSGTVYIEDRSVQPPQDRDLIGYLPFKVIDGQDLYLELNLLDLYGKRTQHHYIHCNKENAFSQQNFIFQSTNHDILFTNKIEKGTTIEISNSRITFSKANVSFFANDNSLPPPPFSQREPMLYPAIPDSTFNISSVDGHSFNLKVARQGIYFIRLDSANIGGCLIMGVEPNFPKVQSHEQMIASSRFIMSQPEYQKLIDATDKQAAIESFWIGLAGSQDRAREMIKHYYNRVQEANRFFTSHIEGWKTDMGMVYIVFGAPTTTYKTANMETWVYGQENTPNSVTFRFDKIKNPFSENCFRLQRGPQFKDPWTLAAQNWREGRVNMED
ncbi:MAG: GWxTD domain-containing protein [Bacteroidia bacterium]